MRYDPKKIELKWQKRWLRERVYEPDFKGAKRPFYNLMMFPYPSAEGLHMGAVRTFSGVDIYGRFKRMQGYDVFEPIGLDGFGIHSENYALKVGKHPIQHAKDSEKNFYRQLKNIGNGFAWKEKIETYDPNYYKWTQWIFVQMFKRGLAYRKKASVNWCPSCMTVLADEQVIQKTQNTNSKIQTNSKSQIQNSKHEIRTGVCERCDTPVVKKDLEQWFFKITNYAERLLKNLEKMDWPDPIKIAQKNWIGRSEGALIKFSISNSQFSIDVFTTRPDTLFGATYLVLSPEHRVISNFSASAKATADRQFSISNQKEVEDYIKKATGKTEEEWIAEGREKTGVELKGVKATNPATNEEISIWIADYVLGHVGTGAIMAVPAHDERDFEFAKKYNLPIKIVICPHYPAPTCPVLDTAYIGEGHLVDSDKFNGMASREARWAITEFVRGERKTNYRLRDWLISRQRYWGPPIPMIYCNKCGWQPVPEKDLPVKLPYIKNFRPTGTEQSPLASVEKFYKVRCPKCKSWARRETDVSDAFLDSSWYFLRYPSINEKKYPWHHDITKKWLPVHSYIGGAEHSVLHLLYSRFVTMALHDWGVLHFEEPFKKFRTHGLITKDGFKMSKSRGNVVNPDDYIRVYGIDAIRMYLAFLAPFNQGGDFRDTGIRGLTRFLERTWRFVQNSKSETRNPKQIPNSKSQIQKTLHRTIKKVTQDLENLQYNTAISALMVLLNEFEANAGVVTREHINIFLKLLAPFAPFITEELWSQMEKKTKNKKQKPHKSIYQERWPEYDSKLPEEDKATIAVQINGKFRDRIEVKKDISEDKLKQLVLSRAKIKQLILDQNQIKKFIYIKDKLVNFVI